MEGHVKLCQKRVSCVPFYLRALWPTEIWRVPSADFRPQFVGEGWTRLLQGCSLPSAAWVSRSRRQPWVLLLMLQPKRSPINSQTLSQEAAGGSKTKPILLKGEGCLWAAKEEEVFRTTLEKKGTCVDASNTTIDISNDSRPSKMRSLAPLERCGN